MYPHLEPVLFREQIAHGTGRVLFAFQERKADIRRILSEHDLKPETVMRMIKNLRRGEGSKRVPPVACIPFPILFVLLLTPLPTLLASPPEAPLLFDGWFEEWEGLELARDPGDAGEDGIDLDSLAAQQAEGWIALHFTTGRKLVLQNGNSIRMLVDLDADRNTGVKFGEAGVDLIWDFAEKEGLMFEASGRSSRLTTPDVGLFIQPSFASTRFEVAVKTWCNITDKIRVRLESTTETGDVFPAKDFLEIPLNPSKELPDLSLGKQRKKDLRVMLWNCGEGLSEEKSNCMASIAHALDPELLVLVDVEEYDEQGVREMVEGWELKGGKELNVVKQGYDVAVASPWPILGHWDIPGMPRGGLYLLELPKPFASPVLLAAIHPICCNNDRIRQEQADALLVALEDAYSVGGNVDVDPDVPLMIIGDTNLIGWKSQYRNYTLGQFYNDELGPLTPPAANKFPLTDLRSRHPEAPFAWTWRDDETHFSPARIDLMFLPNSVVTAKNHFVFDTRLLSEKTLKKLGLKREDSPLASDHIPHVVDLAPAK